MSHVLVLGADGFIGSHLVDALLARGHRVRAFDRFSDGVAHHLSPTASLELRPGDFLNRSDVRDSLEGIDAVFHMVSLTTPATSGGDPLFDIDTNVRMSVELMRLCSEHRIGRVIFPSSGGAIYGGGPARPLSEDDLTMPVSPYAIGKLAIEGYLRFFRHSAGLDSIVLRISNPYGERQNIEGAQGVIPIFLRRMLKGDPLTVYGDGSMVRDYIYVLDLVNVMADVFEREVKHHLYNLGSGRAASVLGVIRALEEASGLSAQVEHLPFRPTDVQHVVLDVSRLELEMGPLAPTPLNEGLARTLDYVRSVADDRRASGSAAQP